jgi:hypothetical protein
MIGGNYQTESIVPRKWFYSNKRDSKNILDIYEKFGNGKKLNTFPVLSFYEYLTFGKEYGKYLSPLSYLDYNKDKAKQILIKELGWQDYGGKHHESFITKFYQSYILPHKFGIDKKRAHLSSLICANQITRIEALEELKKPYFKDEMEEKDAIEYFIKKMELGAEEFDQLINLPRKEHSDFKSHAKNAEKALRIARTLLLKKQK